MGVRLGRLARALSALMMAIAVAPSAFGQDSPVNGMSLFNSNGIQACTACHVNVENRRAAIDPGGDLDFDLVYATFLNAIATVSVMNKFSAFTTQQKRNIAAYIADVPKARPNLVDFVATNTSIETAPVTITFSNATTATSSLTLGAIGLTGSAADFLIKTAGTTCAANNQVLGAGASCNVSVSFRTSSTTTKVALLNFPYTQGGSVNRTAQLSGTVAGSTPPSSSASGGGGGAFSLWWAGLLLLALGLRPRMARRP